MGVVHSACSYFGGAHSGKVTGQGYKVWVTGAVISICCNIAFMWVFGTDEDSIPSEAAKA
jgi:hypothetical protein